MSNFGVFFDLDGTLVDSLPDICGNLNRVRESLGLVPLDMPQLRQWIGKGVEHLIRGAFPEFSADRHEELVLRYRKQYLETPLLGGRPYPGVDATLRYLRAVPGMKLGIATNKSTSLAEKMIELYFPGLLFDFIAGPERVSRQKPAADHLLEVLAKVKVAPEQAFFMGDDPVDRACAQAAGVRFFAATWGIGRVEASPAERLAAFPELLEKLRAAMAIPAGDTV